MRCRSRGLGRAGMNPALMCSGKSCAELKWKMPPRRAGPRDVPCAATPNLLLAPFAHRQGSPGWGTSRIEVLEHPAAAGIRNFLPPQ